jgi:sortase A
MKKSTLRWIERALLVVGILLLGVWAYAWIDARVVQFEENRLLDEAGARSGQPPPGRAAETDALASFHERDVEKRQRREPKEEGSLVGRVEIPRLGVSGIVLEGVGKKTLRRGIGRIPGTALPEDGGNVGLAAHRDSFFRGLKDIRKNDIITLKTLENTYYYRVDWTEIVRPEDTHVLADKGEPELTLVTCYPFYYVGSAPKRFIVRAQRIDEAAAVDELTKEGS